ncbi:MAG: hypothetical protein MJ152_01275 [Clostridia bacterium]|nr:hypothetical protein [Clostridia bacterium]
MKDFEIMANSYKQLFYLTGNIVFYNTYKFISENKTAIYLEEENTLQL